VPADVTTVSLGGLLGEPLVPKSGVIDIPVRPWEIVTLRITR